MGKELIREKANQIIESKKDEILEISNYIFNNPETGLHEFKAASLQKEFLKKYGFEVKEKLAGLETSFIGEFRNGDGPTIAIFSEYDCLPDGLDHACGHNLIAAATMGSAIAGKKLMEENDIKGTLMIVGAPDEEFTGGKKNMLEAGLFDKVDCAMAVHPTSAVSRVAGGNNAYQSYKCEYFGKTVSAGNRPWDGISAQDAVLLFFNALSYARQMLRDGVRVSAYVLDGMSIAGSIAGHATLYCDISAPQQFMLDEAIERVERCFKAGAVGTGCQVKFHKTESSKNRIPNGVMGDLFRDNCEFLGEEMQPGMPDDNGGEDLGDVSHVIPAINPHLTIYKERKISIHTDEFRDHVKSNEAERMCLLSAKALALTALDLMINPNLVEEAKKELKQRIENLK